MGGHSSGDAQEDIEVGIVTDKPTRAKQQQSQQPKGEKQDEQPAKAELWAGRGNGAG